MRIKNIIRIKQKRICGAVLAAVFLIGMVSVPAEKETAEGMVRKAALEIADSKCWLRRMPLYAGVAAEINENEMAFLAENRKLLEIAAARAEHPEEYAYSFLQGPKSWSEGRVWSGEWSGEYVKGNYFGNFGCGLCCMANIYCTFSGSTCSPWDMYEYARQVSGYHPTRKVGAIGWADMKVTLKKSGFDCSLCNKPASYEDFQEQIKDTKSAIVLVCSRDDDTFWEKTGGHYVNIAFYREETDEVFLADPSGPAKNRTWIPLRYVYDALKTASQYQYLLVNDYARENNLWQQDGIDEAWVSPDKM